MHYSPGSEAVKVQTLAIVLGTVSGLRFVAPDLEPEVTIATAAAMHLTYAIVCRVFAGKRQRPALPWFLGGLVGGAFAFFALLLLGEPGETPPPPS